MDATSSDFRFLREVDFTYLYPFWPTPTGERAGWLAHNYSMVRALFDTYDWPKMKEQMRPLREELLRYVMHPSRYFSSNLGAILN
jgi:hypothetical protein